MSYLSKIAPFSLFEKFSIFKFTIGSRLINAVPNGIKNTYLLTNRLSAKKIKIERFNDSVRFNYPINSSNQRIQLKRNSSDAQVFEQIMELKEYLPILKILQEHNIKPLTMIDAGANIGLTCLYFKAYFPEISIIALEPSEETFNRLSQNIEINNHQGITVLNKGLWSTSTRLKADKTFRDGQDWSFRLVDATEHENALFETTSMLDLLSDYQIDVVDFLKIDIEGGEDEVFNIHSDISWLQKIKIITIEIHDEFNCRERIERMLKENNFELTHSGELTIGVNNKLVI